MNRKIRYSILAAGTAAFVVLAPIIILYVRGISFDFKTRAFTATGILAIKAEPSEVEVFLDNKLARDKAEDIKFLLPGEYEVSLKKNGYHSWSKRLKIEAGQVTSGNLSTNKIYLLKDIPASTAISGDVLDFDFKNGSLVYLTAEDLVVASGNNFSEKRTFKLPSPANQILEIKGDKAILADTGAPAWLFDLAKGTSVLLPAISQWRLSDNGSAFGLSGSGLYRQGEKTPLLKNVKAFSFLGSDLYMVQENGAGNVLAISQPPYNQSRQILNGLPSFTSGELLVTGDKKVFLVADQNLYLAGDGMKKLAGNISSYVFNAEDSSLLVFSAGEFGYYNGGGDLTLISRSSQVLQNLGVSKNIGYGFYSNDQGLTAIELDSRDRQNQYLLYSSSTLKKFTLDSEGENVVLLDNGELKTLNIR